MCTGWDPKSPSLLPSIICYADLLGFRNKIERAFESGEEEEFLRRVSRSVGVVYDDVRKYAALLGRHSPTFHVKVFTDNIVVAYSLSNLIEDLGEPELGTLMSLFARVQASLAADGFFLRGAIAAGQHYQDRDIVYGEALLEVYDLDKSGGPPRLVIGSSVKPLISEHLSWYADGWAPHHTHLLEDASDERLFVNYLKVAFENFPDGPIDHELLAVHRRNVCIGLQEHESNESVLPKYKWMAAYHDYVCRTFADDNSIGGDEGADSYEMAVEAEAQRVLDHLLLCEDQPAEQPFQPLRNYLKTQSEGIPPPS